jgi:hypothetical protein
VALEGCGADWRETDSTLTGCLGRPLLSAHGVGQRGAETPGEVVALLCPVQAEPQQRTLPAFGPARVQVYAKRREHVFSVGPELVGVLGHG